MKEALRAERNARIGIGCTILTGALVLGPVYERWPDGVLAYILTAIFAMTLLTFAFRLTTAIGSQCASAFRYVRVVATRPFREN